MIMHPLRSTDWIWSFQLSSKCTFTNLKSSSIIEFKEDGNAVSGFDIHFPNTTEQSSETIANRIATKLAMIITFKVGVPVQANCIGFRMKKPQGGWTTERRFINSWSQFENLDLDVNIPMISNLLHKTNIIEERFYHAYLGLRAARDHLYEAMIIQFYQSVEKVLPAAKKYRSLRNMLSHPEKPFPDDVTELTNDGFEFTSDQAFDFSSPKNNQLLKVKAEELKVLAITYLRQQLK